MFPPDLGNRIKLDESVFIYHGDCIEILGKFPKSSVSMIFADPPYFLSNGGVTCHAGKMVSVDKGEWDKSKGLENNFIFTLEWLLACQKVMKDDATIWISGTMHIIYMMGYALQKLGFRLLNDIVWYKRNAPPHLACKMFAHATEIILWAAKKDNSKYYFNYDLMKKMNKNKQMRSIWDIPLKEPENVWEINTAPKREKAFGKHPTQKPIELLERIILASTRPDEWILDPFAGSSSTGIAAIRNGRKYIGIEKEKEFINLSKNKLTNEKKQMKIPDLQNG